MNHRSALNEIAQFLENQRKQTLQEASALEENSDEQLKKIIHKARMQQHSLIRGSIAEMENTRRIEHATSLLEARASGISAKQETKFHEKLDTLVHDTFGKRKEEKDVSEELDKSKDDPCWKATRDADKVHLRSTDGLKTTVNHKDLVEAVEIQELSKNTLGSYINKATTSAARAHASAQAKKAGADEVDRFTNRHMEDKFKTQDDIKKKMGVDNASIEKDSDKARARVRGIGSAVKRLIKEALDEVKNVSDADFIHGRSKELDDQMSKKD